MSDGKEALLPSSEPQKANSWFQGVTGWKAGQMRTCACFLLVCNSVFAALFLVRTHTRSDALFGVAVLSLR